MSENEEFIGEFLEECDESLDQLDKDLLALEQNPRDKQRLESVFRTIHTIKGTSGFFGFAKLGALAHDGETLLGRLRDGEIFLNQEIATTLLQLIDGIRQMLASIRDSGAEGATDFRSLSASLIRLAMSPSAGPAADPSSDEGPPLPATIGASDRAVSADPTELTTPEMMETDASAAVADSREPMESIEPAESVEAIERAESVQLAVPVPQGPPHKPASEGSIRVDVHLLDELLDLAGELVLARNQLNQQSSNLENTALWKTIQRLSLITSELQEGVMQTRMQPMATIWRKFPRVVRDLALACGKEIELVQEGEQTELDRSLLEAIKDPLTHLIRNAVDHGIEAPEVRVARGKPRKGRMLLRAYHEGGQVGIELTDDGGGIDVSRVRQRALERGLIDAERVGSISEEDLVQLIFLPGFSTAQTVTDVSGRGVGMDVVRTNIERIGGTILLHNRPGLGTTVRITIPLTLAIIPALIVTCGSDRFAIPRGSLLELVNFGSEAAREAIEWVHDAPVCRLRGSLIPLVYLSHVLELARDSANRCEALNLVVLQVEGCRFGLVVDQVVDTEEIVVKPLSRWLKSIPVFAGATIMGDGTVALILDVAGLARKVGLSVAKTERVPAAVDADPGEAPQVSYLLCENHERRRIAIRLAEVQRLEELPSTSVELAGSHEVIQYGGQIMPLLRLSRLLHWSDSNDPESGKLAVVVLGPPGHHAGLVVPRIADIFEGPPVLDSGYGETGFTRGSSVIDGRVTDVIDLAAVLQIVRCGDTANP